MGSVCLDVCVQIVRRLGWSVLISVGLVNWMECEGLADLCPEGFGEEFSPKDECAPTDEASGASESTGEDSCVRRDSGRHENEVCHYPLSRMCFPPSWQRPADCVLFDFVIHWLETFYRQ